MNEGTIQDLRSGYKKRKNSFGMEKKHIEPEVVLEVIPPTIMKISWNYRGLGSPRALRALLRLIHLENPDMFFLMETLQKEK